MKVRSMGFAILQLFTSVGIFKFSLTYIFYARIFNHLTILQGLHFFNGMYYPLISLAKKIQTAIQHKTIKQANKWIKEFLFSLQE